MRYFDGSRSEVIGLRNIHELGDDARDFVKTAFVLVLYFTPPLFIDSLKTQNLYLVSIQGPLFEMYNAFILLSFVPMQWPL